ncbi:MAG: 30S ribosomal protein S17 [Candidatus Thermoplasmatota archaeon]|nr:30S ribosomal protein S17 [Candidatus Thermoplasmatota archaeon]MDP7264514.1 30S ribosomal protein S17 [Candidatus Thermoplasmatota archaeon]MDP7421832.1 30S ribosomal protein S17 [bacterium]
MRAKSDTGAGKARNIGISVPSPKKVCQDVYCPFHGKLSVRGQILEGIVSSTKMNQSAVVMRERLFYIKKYERYEKRTSRHSVHNPPCLGVRIGDRVKIAECRPLAKTVSFVIIERRKPI